MLNSPNKLHVNSCGCDLEFDLAFDRGRISAKKRTIRKFGIFSESQFEIAVQIWATLPPTKGDKKFSFDETPHIFISWTAPEFDFRTLVGNTLTIEESFIPGKNCYQTGIVLYGEMGFYDVRITFVELESDQLRVRISGVVADIHSNSTEWMQVRLDTVVTKV